MAMATTFLRPIPTASNSSLFECSSVFSQSMPRVPPVAKSREASEGGGKFKIAVAGLGSIGGNTEGHQIVASHRRELLDYSGVKSGGIGHHVVGRHDQRDRGCDQGCAGTNARGHLFGRSDAANGVGERHRWPEGKARGAARERPEPGAGAAAEQDRDNGCTGH